MKGIGTGRRDKSASKLETYLQSVPSAGANSIHPLLGSEKRNENAGDLNRQCRQKCLVSRDVSSARAFGRGEFDSSIAGAGKTQ